MNAKGNPTTLDQFEQRRRTEDRSRLTSNVLLSLDIFAGLALTCLLNIRHSSANHTIWLTFGVSSALSREILLCNIIASLLLRTSQLRNVQSFVDYHRLMLGLLTRCVGVLTAVTTLELVMQRYDQHVFLSLMSWSTGYMAWFCYSRTIVVTCMSHKQMRAYFRTAVAATRATDVARVAASLAADAAVVAAIEDTITDVEHEISGSTTMAELIDLVGGGDGETIIVAFDRSAADALPRASRDVEAFPIQVTVCYDSPAELIRHQPARPMTYKPVRIHSDHQLQYWHLALKSLIDVVCAVVLICLLSPIGLLISLAIIIDTPGSVIFKQQRSGWGGRAFTIFKFRTMYDGADAIQQQTSRNDPRCTRVGSILRRTSLDELPQLWNVLRGEMSLVGPRPHAEILNVVDRAGCRVVAEYALRHRMKPGLTGWAQIHGSRGAVNSAEDMRVRIEYDLHYIEHWSLWLDIYILIVTPYAVAKGVNAF